MPLNKAEYITASGLRVSMPVPGIIRVTDGTHKHSYMVSAKLRKTAPKLDGTRLVWGKVAGSIVQGMVLLDKSEFSSLAPVL